ncbi:MAG: hypothetical protein ACOYD9_05695 [Pyramidobacter sp.]|jgi:hypothetical protein
MMERLYARKALLTLAALFLCARLCSSVCPFAFAAHHCTGRDCPVCAELRVCRALLHAASAATPSSPRLFSVQTPLAFPGLPSIAPSEATPVSLKVRLLN